MSSSAVQPTSAPGKTGKVSDAAMNGQAQTHPHTNRTGFLSAWIAWIPFILLSIPGFYTAAFATAFVVQLYQMFQSVRRRSIRVIDTGAFLFFAAGTVAVLRNQTWFVTWSTVISYGLFAVISFTSLLLREPFTMQYARETVPEQYWHSKPFIFVNDIITLVWGLSFLVGMALGVVAVFTGNQVLNLVGLLAPLVAVVFTARFPAWYERHEAASHPA
jgi:hypothetical protein